MQEVLRYNIWNFQFSVEGASEEIHDARVGSKGAWRKLIRAIENAKELGVRFITNTTMTRASAPDMFRIIDLLDSLGVTKMNIGNTLPECAGRNCSVMFEYPEVVKIAEQLTLYALTKRIGFSFITPLPVCLKEGRVISNPSVCSAGEYSKIIDTDGRSRPCSVSGPECASRNVQQSGRQAVLREEIEEIVRQRVRNDIPAECRSCSKFRQCGAGCPLYWKVGGVSTPSMWKREPDLRALPV
jgi:radical SAM protein with 4Fe4S-binding SPASM domain